MKTNKKASTTLKAADKSAKRAPASPVRPTKKPATSGKPARKRPAVLQMPTRAPVVAVNITQNSKSQNSLKSLKS